MDKKVTYAIIAVVAILIVAGVAYVALSDDDSDNDKAVGDSYYIYIDGVSDKVNGWHVGVGETAEEGYLNALDNDKIAYDIDKGWVKSIDGKVPETNFTYGAYGYSSVKADTYNSYFFVKGPAFNDLNTNIAYIGYTEYDPVTFEYKTTPQNSPNAKLVGEGGPFKDADYKPLDYANEYSFYLDGMGDINGWYTGTGENADVALKNALDAKKIAYDIKDGWINSINGLAADTDKKISFVSQIYMKNHLENASGYDFAAGPVLSECVGNIIYIAYAQYDANWANPTPSAQAPSADNVFTTGPFAA